MVSILLMPMVAIGTMSTLLPVTNIHLEKGIKQIELANLPNLPADEHLRNEHLFELMKHGEGNEFVKLSQTGKTLQDTAQTWGCVVDKKTGLFWEVKTDDGAERDYRKKYRWGTDENTPTAYNDTLDVKLGNYEANPKTHKPAYTAGDRFEEWVDLVDAANDEKLCGYDDWRMASVFELNTLSTYYSENKGNKATSWEVKQSETGKVFINPNFFPSVAKLSSPWYWSASPNAHNKNHAWGIYLSGGYSYYDDRQINYYARLVRCN